MERTRSRSPSRMAPARGRSGDLPRGRSGSPSRMAQRGRSREPPVRGRSGDLPPRAHTRSASPSRMAQRGRSREPPVRGRSGDLPPRAHTRSASPSRMAQRGRSREPPVRGPSGDLPPRGRSSSPSRMANTTQGGRKGPGRRPMRRLRESIQVMRRPKARAQGTGEGNNNGASREKKNKVSVKRIRKSIARIAPKDQCGWGRLCSYFIPITMIFISSGGLIYATGNQDKFTPDFIIDLIPNFNKDAAREADPFSGTTSTAKWNNGGGSGVEIEFLNALDDSWQVIFALAIADWEFGTPDALTLKSEQIAHEVECEAVQGKIKVCNGNYGETNWRGINLAVLDSSGFITSSSAKMNQYYLDFDPEGAKQYTMCHEVGHAFGLPHTDENFDNEDLGNCLDYTDNFAANMHPDKSNYDFLFDLYGSVGGRRILRKNWAPTVNEYPATVKQKLSEALPKMASQMEEAVVEDGWRVLHQNKHGIEHELDLGEGYKARMHRLLVH